MDPQETEIIAILVGGAVGGIILLVAVFAIARRRLEKGWRATQEQRSLLYDRLKAHGLLVRRFIETADNRLHNERDSLEVLSRRLTRVNAGRTPPEKAAAVVELNGLLDELLSVADNDPGLSGLSEYETLRDKIERAVDDIGRTAATYNETVDAYNRKAAGFFGRMFGSMKVERFDASAAKKAGRL